jgi:hypothetical protein
MRSLAPLDRRSLYVLATWRKGGVRRPSAFGEFIGGRGRMDRCSAASRARAARHYPSYPQLPCETARYYRRLPRDKQVFYHLVSHAFCVPGQISVVNSAREVADRLWREHHRANLRENIQPTRTRADVVLHKRSDHSVAEV